MKWPLFYTSVYFGLFCLFFFGRGRETVCAQTPAFSTDYFTRFRHLTTEDGLGADKVLDILQDKYGIMWFATLSGLTKYDGFRFTTYFYSADDPYSLSCNEVTSLVEDRQGNLWIGTRNGLNRYDRRENVFVRYTTDEQTSDAANGLRNNAVKALYADSLNNLWVETEDGFLSRLDFSAKKWKHFKHVSASHEGEYYYWHIFEDSRHNLWIGGRRTSAFLFSREKQTFEEFSVWSKEGIPLEGTCFVETKDKQLLSPNEGFLAGYNEENRRFEYRYPLPLQATCALRDQEDNIWIGGRGGVLRFRSDLKEGIVFRHISQNDFSLLSDQVNCLYEDQEGRIWIGTDAGVSFYSKNLNAFRYYRRFAQPPYSLSSDKIKALLQDRDGLLWVGTEDCGVDTLSLPLERVGNLTYRLLTKELDEKTFMRERKTLEQYVRHGLIVPSASFQPGAFSYPDFRRATITYKLNENNVSALYQDKKGIIYIGLWAHVGFNTYDKKTATFRRYALWSKKADWLYPMLLEGNPFGSNWYSGFLEDGRSRFWCVTWEGFGLNLFNRATGEFEGKHYRPVSAPCPPRGEVSILTFDTCMGRMYMSGERTYYGYYDFKTKMFKRYGEILPSDYPNRDIICRYYRNYSAELLPFPLYFSFRKMLGDGQGHIWLADQRQILKHTLADNSVESVYTLKEKGDFAWCVSKDKRFIIIGQKNRLGLLSIQNAAMKLISFVNEKLAGETIRALFEDGNRHLWIGTDKGLWKYSWKTRELNKISIFPGRKELLNSSVLLGDEEGGIYIGCDGGVVLLKEGKMVREYRFDGGQARLPGNKIQGLYLEKHDKLWIATNEGLVLCEGGEKKAPLIFRHDEKDPYSLPDNAVRAIAMAPDSTLWLATAKGICVYHPQTGRFEDKSQPDNRCLTSRLASCILEDHSGNIWLGTTEKGLNVLHTPEDTIAHYTYRAWDKNGLSSNCIYCLFEDSRDRIWVGTDKGLCRYREQKGCFEYIEDLQERQIQSIQEDAAGYLWIATDKGLYCLSASGRIKRSFYDFHGLQGNFFNAGTSCRLKDGRLAFGGNYGFNLFRPEELLQEVMARPVVLSDFKVRDSVRYADANDIEQVRLTYKENSFSVDFTAVDYEFNSHLSYRYRLLPFDRDWIYTDPSVLRAKYTNLPPDNYRFEVEASNPYGEWTGKARVLSVFIATPWYLQVWFFCLSVFVCCMLIMVWIRYREKRLQERNEYLEKVVTERTEQLQQAVATKDKFFAIISHDLKGPCLELEQMSGELDIENQEAKEEMKKSVSLLRNTAKEINGLLNKLLDWARSQEKMIEPYFQQACLQREVEISLQFLRPVADQKKIRLRNRLASGLWVYTDTNMLATILRNLVSNAIKYSYRESEVAIQGEDKGNYVEVSVIDRGIGMDEARLRKLFRIDAKNGFEARNGSKVQAWDYWLYMNLSPNWERRFGWRVNRIKELLLYLPYIKKYDKHGVYKTAVGRRFRDTFGGFEIRITSL